MNKKGSSSGLKCNPILSDISDCNKALSQIANLPSNISIDPKEIVNAMQAFAAIKGIEQKFFHLYKREALPYMAKMLGIGMVVETSDKELANAIEVANNAIPSGILDDTPENRELAAAATDATGMEYSVLKLKNNKIKILTPKLVRKELETKSRSTAPTAEDNTKIEWSRYADNNYEVSSAGDSRFSALNAKFKKGTVIDGVDVSNKSIEEVYQKVIKKSGKGKAPSAKSKIYKPYNYRAADIPFIQELAKLGRVQIPSYPSDTLREIDRKRADANRITKQSKSYRIYTEMLDLQKFADVNIEDLAVENTLLKKLKEFQSKLNKSKNVINPSNQVLSKDAAALAKQYNMLQQEQTALLNEVSLELWNTPAETTPSSFNAKDLSYGEGQFTNKEDIEDFSYEVGYLPLWQEWAVQNPELIEELREKTKGKVLTDKFASTRVSQARALADILNSASPVSEDTEITPVQKTLDNYLEEVDDMIDFFSSNIQRGKGKTQAERDADFEKNHTYYIKDKSGKFKKVDRSVTEYNKDLLKIKPYSSSVDTPGKRIGNTFDAFVRDYFSAEGLKPVYDNLNKNQRAELKRQLDLFRKALDKQFGIDPKTGKRKYQVITKEFPIGGYINSQNGKTLSIAGTMDMLVVTDTGDIYIYDMKTSSQASLDGVIPQYSGQLTLYKNLIGGTFPELASRIKGVGLLVAKTNYSKDYDNYRYEGNEIFYDDSPIYKDENYSIELAHKSAKNLNDFIDYLNYSEAVEELEFMPLTREEKEAIEDMPAGEDKTDFEKDLEGKAKETSELATESKLNATISTASELSPVSSREVVFIGRSMVKMVSWLCDRLSNGDYGHSSDDWKQITGLDKYFKTPGDLEGVPADEILKMRDGSTDSRFSIVWPTLLNYLKNYYFNIKGLDFGSPEYEKVKWIRQNFTYIMNGAYAELVSIEGVSVTGVDAEVSDEIKQMYEMGAREEDGREAYAIDSRTKSYEESIPTKLKRKLAKLGDYKLDKDGKPLMDEHGLPVFNEDEFGYGIPLFLDKHEVINFLMHNMHYYTYASQMLDALRESAKELPWIQQVVDMLESSPELMTMFKVSFRKNETYYNKLYATVEGYGKYAKKTLTSIPLNEKSKILNIINNVSVKVVDPDQSNIPALFSHDSDDALGVLSVDSFMFETFKEYLKILSPHNSTDRKAKIKILKRVLNLLGIDNIDNLNALKDKGLREQFNAVVRTLDQIKRTLEKQGRKTFNFSSLLQKNYYALATSLAVAMQNNVEISSYDGEKSYMTYTDPSFIETLLDKLSGKIPNSEDVLNPDNPDSPYNHYRAYSYINSKGDGERIYVNSWLDKMVSDPDSRNYLRHTVRTTADDAPYIKQSDNQYWLALLVDYFAPTTSKYFTGRKDLRMFRVPTMGDKPAGESIQFPVEAAVSLDNAENNYNLEEMKDTITEKAFEYFKYELLRMRSVIEQLRDGTEETDVEDFHIKRSKAKDLIAKLRSGNAITEKDLLDSEGKLLPIFRESGMSFRYLPMFNQFRIKVKANGTESLQLIPIAKQIINYINGKSIDYSSLFPMFSREYQRAMETRYEEFRTELAQSVSDAELDRDLPNVTSDATREALLQEYFWNDSLAAMNVYNLLDVDPAYYKNTVALQKRAPQWHSSTVKVDMEATFETEDGSRKKLSDGYHRTIILEDVFTGSVLAQETKKVFLQRAQEARAKHKTKQAKEYELLAETVPSFFKSFNNTDGQALGSPTGFWKKLNMLGEFNPEFTQALNEIRKGNFNINNFRICIQPFKPFLFSHIHKDGSTILGDELVPIQIKDSEAMILLAGAIIGHDSSGNLLKTPLKALFDFLEETHYGANEEHSDKTYSQTGIDTIAFHSAVKSGAFNVLNINGLSYDEALEVLRSAYLKDDSGNILRDSQGNIRYDESIVKTSSFEDWGKQQNVPPHMQNHEQGMGSQTRVLFVTDIPDDVTVSNNPIIVNGKKYGKQEFLDTYFDLLKQDFDYGIEVVKRTLGLNGPDANKKLSELLVDTIVKDDKYSYEMQRIFRAVGTGELPFAILGDPAIADKVYSTIFSVIKKNVNDEKMKGGPVVQVAPFGLSEELYIYDSESHRYGTNGFDANKGLIYDCYITAPSEEIERLITYSEDNKKVRRLEREGKLSREYEEGEILDMQDIENNELLTNDQLQLIAYRIPTEDKYSIYRMRVRGFLPRAAGETIIMPKEIVALSGTDFDIDKMYTMWKYNLRPVADDLNSALTKVEKIQKKFGLSGDILTDEAQQEMFRTLTDKELRAYSLYRKNRIFSMQWGIGNHSSSVEKQLNPGNYEDLKETVKTIYQGAEEDGDSLMYAQGQVRMHRKNAAGKDFVGIAALNNIAHGLTNFAKISFRPFKFKFIINGTSSDTLIDNEGNIPIDEIFSRFTGERISRVLGKFVGASADNAKEALLGLLNITPTTANIATFLMRFGLSSHTVALLMNHPLVKGASRAAENKGKEGRFEKELASALQDIIKANKYTEDVVNNIAATTDITDAKLLEAIRNKDTETSGTSKFDLAVLQFLVNITPYASAIADLNGVVSLNSTQNAVGPDIYSTIQKEYKIRKIYNDVQNESSVFSESVLDLEERIPFLKPLMDCYTSVLPEACAQFSPLYQRSFRQVLDMLVSYGMPVEYMDEKTLKRILNSYLLFRASQEDLIDTSTKGREDLIFALPIRFIHDRFKYLKDNDLIQSISFGPMTKTRKVYSLQGNVVGIGRERADDLSASWDALLVDPRTAEVSDDILKYMFTRFGFSWDPRSAVSLATQAAKSHLGNFENLFKDTESWDSDTAKNFILQYARNNPKSSLWARVEGTKELKPNRRGLVTLNKDEAGPKVERAIGIIVNGKLYEKADGINENVYYFKPVSRLGVQQKNGTPVLFEYDANTESSEMSTVVTDGRLEKQKNALNIAESALLDREDAEDALEGGDGGETYVPSNPSKEGTTLTTVLDDITTDDVVMNLLESSANDDVVGMFMSDNKATLKNALQLTYDTLSKNKKIAGTYEGLLERIKKEIEKLC